jgi:hypothetical protein
MMGLRGWIHPGSDLGIRTIGRRAQAQEEAKPIEYPFQTIHLHSPSPMDKARSVPNYSL